MHEIEYIEKRFANLDRQYDAGLPTPNITLDNFLPRESAFALYKESQDIPRKHWTHFTRKNSSMQECNNLDVMPVARNFIDQMHGYKGIRWLEKLTGVQGIIGDPFLVGAGYGKSYNGGSLKVHTDFNWNEQRQLHRLLSLIIYLTPDWKPEYGGGLEFYDFNNDKKLYTVDTTFNTCHIWNYHAKGFHGYPKPINCPDTMNRVTLRLFYFISNSTHNPNDLPHRSQYWYDKETNEAYDIRAIK